MKKIPLFIVLLLICNSSLAINIPDFPFVQVRGLAETKVKPDRASVSFELIEFNKDSKAALDTISKRGQEIIALGGKYKITPEYITASSYTKKTKRAENDQYQDLEILGYEVSQEFTIEINNLANYSSLVDQIAALANVRNINPSFDISTRKEVVSRLVKEASADAKQKANDLAEGMGVKLDSVFAVTKDSEFVSTEAVFADYRANFVPPPSFDFTPNSSNMFVPKYIEIKESVNLIYKIKP